MIQPITPQNMVTTQIPQEVLVAFNTLITKNFSNRTAIVFRKDVVELIHSFMKEAKQPMSRNEIIYAKWLSYITYIYKQADWNVLFFSAFTDRENYTPEKIYTDYEPF